MREKFFIIPPADGSCFPWLCIHHKTAPALSVYSSSIERTRCLSHDVTKRLRECVKRTDYDKNVLIDSFENRVELTDTAHTTSVNNMCSVSRDITDV